jgi:hypothetical protein
VVSEMKEVCIRDLSLPLSPICRKGLIEARYCNLRNPVKATSLGHPRYTEARPQYKASNISFQHFNRQARRLEGAGPI